MMKPKNLKSSENIHLDRIAVVRKEGVIFTRAAVQDQVSIVNCLLPAIAFERRSIFKENRPMTALF